MIRQVEAIGDEWLTRREAAKVLRLSEHTLACLRSEGRGPALVKLSGGRSGVVRYRRSEVERYKADPLGYEAAAGEPWREQRRKAIAEKAKPARGKPKGRRR